jgi:hypothetical protein
MGNDQVSEARGRALADIAIAAHHGELAGQHHVGGALDVDLLLAMWIYASANSVTYGS